MVTTERRKIIVVDDCATTLSVCKNVLKAFYEVYTVTSAVKVFWLMEFMLPDLILLDVEMPEMSGYEAIKKLKADIRFAGIPVIFLTAKRDENSELEGFNLGAMDYVSKPLSAPILLKRVANQLLIAQQRMDLIASRAALKDYADNLEIKVHEKTREIVEKNKKALNLQNVVFSTVADLVESRDENTGGHATRTKLYLKAMIDELLQEGGAYASEIAEWDKDFFLSSAQLHDVGKIAISDAILNKPGKLTPEEFEIMKTHVLVGVDAVGRIMRSTKEDAFLRHAMLIVGNHHEKWDGSGYPAGLKGTAIPLGGRLMAVADVYDALVSVRPYKKAFPSRQAAAIIEEGRGSHFDPQLVDIFNVLAGRFAHIYNAALAGTTHTPAI